MTRRCVELRVHGVAGTPPESMLGLAAVPLDPAADSCNKRPTADVVVFGPPEVDAETRAFSWSSMTSGSAGMALWILLLPYMLANVAGWAVIRLTPPTSSSTEAGRAVRIRWVALLVRFAGLLVTAIFVLFALLTLADLAAYQRLGRQWTPLGIAASAAVLLVLFRFTKVRIRADWKENGPRPEGPAPGDPPDEYDPWRHDAEDPVGYTSLVADQQRMWNSPGIIVRLRRIHLAAGWGLVALVSMWALRELGAGWGTTDTIVTAAGAVAVALPVALLSIVTLSDGRNLKGTTFLIRWGAWALALAAVAASVWRVADADLAKALSISEPFLPAVRGAGGVVALALLVTVVICFVSTCLLRGGAPSPRLSEFNVPSLLLTGATVGALFGAGAASLAAKLLGEWGCSPSDPCKPEIGSVINWISTGFTLMLSVLVLILGVRLLLTACRPPRDQLLLRGAREIAQNVSTVLTLLTAIGVVALIIAFRFGIPGGFGEVELPRWIEVSAAGVLLVPVVVAAAALCIKLKKWGILTAVGAAGATIWLLVSGKTFTVLDTELPPATFLSFAHAVAITLPTALVVNRLVSSIRSRQARRGVAVLWDLGNFWPRWFHPFAPPTYSDVAVTRLRDDVRNALDDETGVLLAPHSQGSIIAVASLAYLSGNADHLALLTYGSPLSRLYPQVFPTVFSSDLFETLRGTLSDADESLRWHNLWRSTDPIGGPIVGSPAVPASMDWPDGLDVEVPVDCGRNHSDYPIEDEYRDAAAALRTSICE